MPKTQVEQNGDFLRMIVDNLDKHRKQALRDFDNKYKQRKTRLTIEDQETTDDKIKYHLEQLNNVGRLTASSVLRSMIRMANYGLVDNPILRKLEKGYAEAKHDDNKFVRWIRKSPALSSYVSYYVIAGIIAATSFGTAGAATPEKSPIDKDAIKKDYFEEPKADTIPDSTYVIEAPAEELPDGVYNVLDPNFVPDFVRDNWDDIAVCLLQFETYRGAPKLQGKESRQTYGPGLTWVYEVTADGKIIAHKCIGEWAVKASKFTDEEIWEQVRLHLLSKDEVMYRIQRACKRNKIETLTTEQILALMVAGYQLPVDVGGIVTLINKATTDQAIADAFKHYTGNEIYYNGSMKRRWWCAALYNGQISVDDLGNLQRDVFSQVSLDSVFRKGHFRMSDHIVEYCLGRKNKNETVNQFIVDRKINDFAPKEEEAEKEVVSAENDTAAQQTAALARAEKFKNATQGLKASRSKGFFATLTAANNAQNS